MTKTRYMIPKMIHYCWFGKNPLPEMARKCIESWKKYCPDYDIKEWNEDNFDIAACAYVREAYQARKWAFVSDYARFWILYHYGGLYFDTDVELIKSIDDILERGAFMGCEKSVLSMAVNPGLGLAAATGLGFYKEMLDMYCQIHFILPDGSMNRKTVVAYTTELLEKNGWKRNEKIQQVGEITVYPPEYFCPMDYETGVLKVTDYTRSIHHYDSSWFTEEEKVWLQKKRKVLRKFGLKVGRWIWNVMAFGRQIRLYGIHGAIKKCFSINQR